MLVEAKSLDETLARNESARQVKLYCDLGIYYLSMSNDSECLRYQVSIFLKSFLYPFSS